MHGSLAAGLVVPLEGAVGEVDLHPLGQHPVPQHTDLLALGDGVGGDEAAAQRRVVLHHLRRLHIPGGDEVQQAGVPDAGEYRGHILALLVI
ncbi:hypothetical protein D3C81_1852080 [compost metagenome]